jgi:uncharacterized RDD family membrane protein YckC
MRHRALQNSGGSFLRRAALLTPTARPGDSQTRMTCPLCGDDCTCSFVHADSAAEAHVAVLIDPEQYDRSEEQFAQTVETSAPAASVSAPATTAAPGPPPDPGFWRDEVASRVKNYRVRRQRYVPGSLSLDFEGEGQSEPEAEPEPEPSAPPPRAAAPEAPKIIEFPRPAPVPEMEELAEPISAITTPRILEAEEPMLPFAEQPMSITLDAAPAPVAAGPQPGIELPLQVAAIATRAWASAADCAAVVFAVGAFSFVASRWMEALPPAALSALILATLAALFWAVYQYVFLVYAGITPGQQAMDLAVRTFEGQEAGRARRRWRALAMLISCISLGLGFAWAFFDEDTLCWHDRITRTYLAER